MPSTSTRTTDSGGATHPLNVSYLVVGLVFLGLAAMWALRTSGAIDTDQLGLLLPLTLVGAGAVGLLAFTAKGVSRGRRARQEPDDLDADLWDDDRDAVG